MALSEDQKAKMAEGRLRAREARARGELPKIRRNRRQHAEPASQLPPVADLQTVNRNLERLGEQNPAIDVEAIRRKARAYVDQQIAERQRAARKDAEALLERQLTDEMRSAAGLSSVLDDLIEHTLNCPPFAVKYVIDGVEYHHGYTYTIKRSLYDCLREWEARGWDSEDRAGNPNRKYYRSHGITMNPLLRQRYASDGSAISRETSFSATGGPVHNAPVNNMIPGVL